ncbi:MAG: hypothetical protein JO127_14410 [Caulobacteraceae bacterium]|nr:hypothetical protein [Caulobacteraceae bacterium]
MMINSAAGPLSAEKLGATLMHEHLVAGFPGWEGDTRAPTVSRSELLAICLDRIQELQDGGFSTLLDPCPSDLGRDPELYAEVAARTGFNILFATGLYHEKFAGAYWKLKLSIDPDAASNLAGMYVEELTEGVGPARLKPAAIKLAIGEDPNSAFENILIEAAARASVATGAPIITHTEAVGGDLLLSKLTGFGVPAHKVIIGHSCGSGDKAYHRRIVDGGTYIGFDRFGIASIQPDEVRVDCLHALLKEGFAQQVMVSHDCVFCLRGRMMPASMEAHAAPRSPLHFSREVAPKLRERGVSQETIDSLLRDNPRRYFCEEVPQRQPGLAASAQPA